MKKNIFFIIAITSFLIFAISMLSSVGLYTEWLFFKEVGYEVVFKTTLMAKVKSGLIFGVLTLVFLLLNTIMANRRDFLLGRVHTITGKIYGLREYDINHLVKSISIYLAIAFSLAASIIGAAYWDELLVFMNSTKAAVSDPIFGRDISFFMFKLPFINKLNGFFNILVISSLVLVSANYLFRGGITVIERLVSIDRRVKLHISFLVSLLIANIAFKFYLDRYNLLFSEHGVLFGASYTDVHARLLMFNILIIVFLFISVAFPFAVIKISRYLTVVPLAILGLTYFIGLGLYPSLLQSLKVSPNEMVHTTSS